MDKMIKVEYKEGLIKEYPENTPLSEIAHSFQSKYNYPILIAKVDNVIEELAYNITKKCSIDFYDRSSTFGHTVYSHGVHFLMIVAIKKVLGNDAEVIIQHSIDKGVYCEMVNKEINKDIIKQIESKMEELVKQDFVSKSYYDDALAQRDATKALLDVNKANLAQAKLNLSYTNIYSPIDGKVGDILITEGNLVNTSSGTLVRILSVDPIYVSFTMKSEDYLSYLNSFDIYRQNKPSKKVSI